MALEPGTSFGSYEVAESIGSGGMGEVYRASDTRLKRDVALKVLPPAFVEDADRLARFQREAEILASLNHTNIAQVYGLEQADGQTAIVMELVEGPTLADRLKDGPIPPDEAMGIALQVVSALEAAHANQIVHRDLKPANIKLRDDGTVKVLDFGISKSFDPESVSGSPVMTTPAVTQTGVILGTAAYMSPEQARGKFVDQRTDIWAFGCLLFEMLTGQPAFGGEDVMLTLARVLDRDTDLSSIPKSISPAVRHTLKLCLEKDPRRRIADIRDVRLAMEGKFETEFASEKTAPVAQPLWKRVMPHVGVAIAAGAVMFVLGGGLEDPPVPEPPLVTKYYHDLPEGMSLNRTARGVITVSPTGDRIAYGADNGLYVRRSDELDGDLIGAIAGEEPRNLAFSLDGQWIVYTSRDNTSLMRVSLSGGSPDPLAAVDNLQGVGHAGDRILFGQGSALMSLPAGGGEPETLATLENGDIEHPTLLPGGEYVLASRGMGPASDVIVVDLATGEALPLFAGRRPRYVDPGYVVYFDDGAIIARSFDLTLLGSAERPPYGGPVEMQPGVMQLAPDDPPQFDLSANGTLAYIEANSTNESDLPAFGLAVIGEDGDPRPLDVPAKTYLFPSVSPDGQRLAVMVNDADAGPDIWLYELGRDSEITQFTYGGNSRHPAWRDERTLLFTSDRDGVASIYQRDIDGGGATRLTTPEEGAEHGFPAWTPDGRLAFAVDDTTGADIYVMALDGEPEPLVSTSSIEFGVSFSADGLSMAYTRIEEGGAEVIVAPFPPDDSFRRVSEPGVDARQPVWLQGEGSRRVSFQIPDSMTIEAVDVAVAGLTLSNRSFVVTYAGAPGARQAAGIPGTNDLLITWAPAAGGQAGEAAVVLYPGRIVVIENFTELLRQRVRPRAE